GEAREVTLSLSVPRTLEAGVRGQLAAWFPAARLEPLAPLERHQPQSGRAMLPLDLMKPHLYPLRVPGEREPDPLLGFLGALAQQAEPSGLRLTCGVAPADWAPWAPVALQAA